MIQVTEIGIKGIGPFKKGQRFPVLKGVTYLYGLNHTTGNNNSNAAGKSLLASTIGEVMYDVPMVGTKADKVKTGVRYVKFISKGKSVEARLTGSGKSTKLSVTVDGKVVGATKSKMQDAMATLWPVSEEEFRTYGHLDSRILHPLVMGSSVQRRAFFSDFFGLEQLAHEKKIVLRELSAIKTTRAAFEELKVSYDSIKEQCLDEASVEEMEQQVAVLGRRIDNIIKEEAEIARVQRLLSIESTLKELDLEPSVTDDDVEAAREALRRGKKQQRLQTEYLVFKKELERWREAHEGLPEYDLKDLRAKSREYEEATQVRKPSKPDEVEEPNEPEVSRESAESKLHELRRELAHLDKFGKGVCDKCGAEVKIKRPRKQVEAALDRASDELRAWREYDSQKLEHRDYLRDIERWRENMKAWKQAQATTEANAGAHKLYRKVKDLPSKPEQVEKPEAVDLADLERTLQRLETSLKHRDDLEAIAALTKEQRKSVAASQTHALVAAQDKVSTLKSRLAAHEANASRLADTRKRLVELKRGMRDEQVLRNVLAGYDDKAVKRMIIEAISQHFMKSLNAYSGLVFPNYSFSFEWTPTQVMLLVHRPGHEPTDVRALSGAESRLFTLIVLMALLKFVPPSKRLSLLVLDEPTASFGQHSSAQFHELLPHLCKLIPSIVVVTPRTEERLEGAHEFTVVRTHEGSKVCKNHPDEL